MIFRGFPSPSPSSQALAELTVAQDTMSGGPVPSGARVLVLFPPWLWSGHTSLLMLLEPAGSLPLNPSVPSLFWRALPDVCTAPSFTPLQGSAQTSLLL